jgi:hypothetical protein
MKPFNLQAAIAGAPIQFEDGQKLKFVAYVPEAKFTDRFVFLTADGNICSTSDHTAHIFMTPVMRTHWANVHRSESGSVMVGVSMPDEKAVQLASNFLPGYVKTISFEIEE